MSKILRRSSVLEALHAKKDPLQSERVRTSMMLSARISSELKKKKWSKGDLARALNKNQSIITRWLSGTHNFTSDTLSDIQLILGVQLLVRSEKEQKNLVVSFSVTDPVFQQKMLESNSLLWHSIQSAENGGCTEARSFTVEGEIKNNKVLEF